MYKATQTRIQTYLNDVAGVRIVCAFIDDNRLDEQIRQAVLSLETKWTEKNWFSGEWRKLIYCE